VKSLDDRLKATEWGCEQLLDEFIQIAELKSNINKDGTLESPVSGPDLISSLTKH
jgi:hypothetical protein